MTGQVHVFEGDRKQRPQTRELPGKEHPREPVPPGTEEPEAPRPRKRTVPRQLLADFLEALGLQLTAVVDDGDTLVILAGRTPEASSPEPAPIDRTYEFTAQRGLGLVGGLTVPGFSGTVSVTRAPG